MPPASAPPRQAPEGDHERSGLASVDLALRLVDVSPALAARLGQPADLLRGQPIAEALPGWGAALEPTLRLVIATAAPALNLAMQPPPGGPLPPGVASLYPVLSRGGAVLGVDLVLGTQDRPAAAPVPRPEEISALDSLPGGPVLLGERDRLLARLQQQAHLLDQAHEAMVGWEPGGPITLWNRGAEALYGFSRAEAIGRPARDILRSVHARPEAEIEAELEARGQWQGEVLHTTRDGRAILVESRQSMLVGADGRRVVVEANRDVTNRLQSEENLRMLQAVTARLATALTPADVVAAVLEEGLPALGALYGSVARLEGDELVIEGTVGFPAPSIGRWQRFALTASTPLAEAARTGVGIWLETPDDFQRRYGRLPEPAALAMAQASLALPMIANGRVIGALGVSYPEPRSFDPESRRFAETLAGLGAQALERSRLFEAEHNARRLGEEASRLKDEFLATVSHELRTPLTAFIGYAHLLRSRKRDEEYVARTVERMIQSAQAQAQLIEDLLDVSRIVTGRLRLEAAPIELPPVIYAAIDTVRPAIEARGLRLEVDLLEAGAVIGDAGRLQQVIWNLLANAIKFTPTGGTVTVRLGHEGAEAVITVSDTGLGIDPAFLPFVFDRFRQADSTTKRAHGGLGLGLSIVRHLVELHGGTVQAASAGPWEGASFTVRLPLATGAAEAPPAAGGAGEGPPELRGLRVLLVDDQPAILELLVDVLAPCGAQVRAFTSAREALAALCAWRPDVLVSDIAMPGEDGYWLIEGVRALAPEEGGATPAIALTAYVRVEDRIQVLAAGFQQYVPKPVEPAELRDVVARLVRPGAPR